MSTRNSTPLGPALLLFVGVAILVSLIAKAIFGHLQTTAVASSQLGWWEPLFVVGLPAAVFIGILIWGYFEK